MSDKNKRVAVFLWLKSKGSGIFFIQESHSLSLTETQWRDEWQAKREFAHGTTNARGVMITEDISIEKILKGQLWPILVT